MATTKLLATFVVLAAAAFSAADAMSSGAPTCAAAQPQHHGGDGLIAPQESNVPYPVLVHPTTSTQTVISVMVPEASGGLKGLLIRPAEGTTGKFVSFEDDLFQQIEEGGVCVTHTSPEPKARKDKPYEFVFESEDGGSGEARFDIILVQSYDKFWVSSYGSN